MSEKERRRTVSPYPGPVVPLFPTPPGLQEFIMQLQAMMSRASQTGQGQGSPTTSSLPIPQPPQLPIQTPPFQFPPIPPLPGMPRFASYTTETRSQSKGVGGLTLEETDMIKDLSAQGLSSDKIAETLKLDVRDVLGFQRRMREEKEKAETPKKYRSLE